MGIEYEQNRIVEALNLLSSGLITEDQARQGLPQKVKDRYGIGD